MRNHVSKTAAAMVTRSRFTVIILKLEASFLLPLLGIKIYNFYYAINPKIKEDQNLLEALISPPCPFPFVPSLLSSSADENELLELN